jgi:thiamine biosynthesis lipoprotein
MLHRLPFRAMGCEMLAILEHDSESAPDILKEIPDWFEEWEQILSRFRLNSELSLVNRTFDQPIKVSQTFWDVFQNAQWAYEFSDGLVSPTLLDALIDMGYDRPFDELDLYQDNLAGSVLFKNHPLSMVMTDPAAHTITLPQDVRLDFGGVAKGWAAHQTVERLQEYGACLMNAGGDIAISGPQADGKPWPIGISNPFEPGTDLDVLHLKGCGVASSGRDRRYWNQNNLFRHHIINPFTGLPAESNLLRVTVVAPTVMEAEAAAKTTFILGGRFGMEWIESHPAYAGTFILDNGEMLYSRSMDKYLQQMERRNT